MYKKRINLWSLDKNFKKNEMKAVVRKHLSRALSGKASSFIVRGRQIDYSDVLRYWERKNEQIEDVILQRAASKTPEAVRCFTPIPSPVDVHAKFALPEHILSMLRNYHVGSFESKTWQDEGPDSFCRTTKIRHGARDPLGILFHHCWLACVLFGKGNCQEAGRNLRFAMAEVKDIVMAEEPCTFVELLALLLDICRFGYHEIALSLLRQISAMAATVLGHQHPLRLICQWLALLCQSDQRCFSEMLCSLFKAIADTFERTVGAMHTSTLKSRLILFGFTDPSSHGAQLEKLVHNCENALDPQDLRTIEASLQWADYCWRTSDYKKAKEIAQVSLSRVKKMIQPKFRTYAWALEILAMSQYMAGDIRMAIHNLRDAIIHLLSSDCPYSGVQGLMMLLEKWLSEQGNLAQAAQMREIWTRSITKLELD